MNQELLNSSTLTDRLALRPRRRVLSTSQKFALRQGGDLQNDQMAQSVQRLNRISRFNNRQLFRAEPDERIHSPFTIQALGQEADGVLSRRFPIAGNTFQRNPPPMNNLDNCSDAIKSTDISQVSSPHNSLQSWDTLRTPHFGRQAPSLFSSPTNSERSLQDFHDIAAAEEEDLRAKPSKISVFFTLPILFFAAIALFFCQRFASSDEQQLLSSENIILMILGGFSCSIVAYYLQKLKKKKQLAQGIYSETVVFLTKSKKACLKELVFHFEKKYGKEVVTKTWPLVEALRVSSGKVLVFKDAFQGSYEIFWSI